MPRVLFREKFVDIERLALAGLQGPNAFVDFHTELPQLFDMRQQLPADLLLVGFRECRCFRYGLFKGLDDLRHAGSRAGLP